MKSRKSLTEIIRDGWRDLRVKIIVLSTLFISLLSVIIIVAIDFKKDREVVLSQTDKYETYIDQLLLSKYSYEELEKMSSEELKLAIDMVIDSESTRVLNAPDLRDFLIPAKEDSYASSFILSREVKESWSDEDIEAFWVHLDNLNLDDLKEKNFEYLKAKLKEIN